MAAIITSIEVKKFSIPLISPFVISLGPLYDAENVAVKITTDVGIVGYGECSPFMSINGESAESAVVIAGFFRKILLGKDALNIKQNIALMDSVIFFNNSIKSAFDMALYDIAAQNAGLPLYQFLGGKKNKTIETDYTVSVGEVAAMAKAAKEIQDKGFPAIKVKLGKNGEEDVLRIKEIRAAVGMDIPLRIDANQGWETGEAIATLNAMAGFNIQHCEEPINRKKFLELPKIKAASPIKIMADESCSDAMDAENLIQINACDRFNIKMGKSGGIFKALEIVKHAEQHNIEIQIGAFLESRLAMTAFAHFAYCSDNIKYFDFDTALMFTSDPVVGGLQYYENGRIEVPEAPGLGATFIPEIFE